jgi:hypothetical protein
VERHDVIEVPELCIFPAVDGNMCTERGIIACIVGQRRRKQERATDHPLPGKR